MNTVKISYKRLLTVFAVTRSYHGKIVFEEYVVKSILLISYHFEIIIYCLLTHTHSYWSKSLLKGFYFFFRSPVWEHFITCTDDKMWKIGKRKAEKDEFVGDMNFHTIEAPERIINNNTL